MTLNCKYGAFFTVLALSSITLAAFCLAGPAAAQNIVTTAGEIAITNEDGSPFARHDFTLFTPGIPERCTRTFYIENTGNRHVSIEWELTSSTIQWQQKSQKYCYYENGIQKYTLGILLKEEKYFKPERQQLHLNPQEETKLKLELAYAGRPNSPETFTLTLTFTAITHTK